MPVRGRCHSDRYDSSGHHQPESFDCPSIHRCDSSRHCARQYSSSQRVGLAVRQGNLKRLITSDSATTAPSGTSPGRADPDPPSCADRTTPHHQTNTDCSAVSWCRVRQRSGLPPHALGCSETRRGWVTSASHVRQAKVRLGALLAWGSPLASPSELTHVVISSVSRYS